MGGGLGYRTRAALSRHPGAGGRFGGRARGAIAEFFTGFYETAIAPGEVLTGVRVPAVPPGARGGYVKFCPRSAEDKPLIGVAALLVLDAAKRVGEVRIALAGARPRRCARAAPRRWCGSRSVDRVIREAADAASAEADPLSDLMGSPTTGGR